MRGFRRHILGISGAVLGLTAVCLPLATGATEPGSSGSNGYPSSSRNENSIPPYSVLPSSPAIAAPTAIDNAAHTLLAKALLLHLGYDVGSLDIATTARFKAAIFRFQKDHGLTKTGDLDTQTYGRLMEMSR